MITYNNNNNNTRILVFHPKDPKIYYKWGTALLEYGKVKYFYKRTGMLWFDLYPLSD